MLPMEMLAFWKVAKETDVAPAEPLVRAVGQCNPAAYEGASGHLDAGLRPKGAAKWP